MLHELVKIWFQWVMDWGYWGVFILMAMESTIIPVPSEIVVPPAAYWASQGKMDFGLVVFFATLGSYVGSSVNYWVSKWLGLPLLQKYGNYFLLPPDKLKMAENWVKEFGFLGIFCARLLPVVRHLISIPAGILKMDFLRFSAATLLGSLLWCWVLAWFGEKVIGDEPELLNSPESLAFALKRKLVWFIVAVVLLGLLYGVVHYYRVKPRVTKEV